MKKRKTTKRKTRTKTKSNSSKKCRMSLKEKEFMAVTIFAVFIFAFLLAMTTTPQQNANVTGKAVSGLENIDTSQIGQFLTNIIDPTKADATVIKWVIFFTFALGLWGIMSLFFKKGKGGAIKLLSLPIAFAMVYLLKTDEIFAGLIGYSALGMTVIVIVPFLTIIFFSVKLLEKESPIRTVTEIMVWYFYLAFLIYFFIRAFITTEVYNPAILGIMIGGIIVSIFAIFKNGWVRNKIHKFNLESERKRIERNQAAQLTHAKGQNVLGETLRSVGEKTYS